MDDGSLGWHCHALVTALFWGWLCAVGPVYHTVRWWEGHRASPLCLGESVVPVVLAVLCIGGWWQRRKDLYLLGSGPVVLFAVLWWLHAGRMRCPPVGSWDGWVVVPILLYLELTRLLLEGG